jgi:hypothetical protein
MAKRSGPRATSSAIQPSKIAPNPHLVDRQCQVCGWAGELIETANKNVAACPICRAAIAVASEEIVEPPSARRIERRAGARGGADSETAARHRRRGGESALAEAAFKIVSRSGQALVECGRHGREEAGVMQRLKRERGTEARGLAL